MAATALVASTVVWGAVPAPAASLIVNSTADVVDLVPGDGSCDTGNTVGPDPECTLRAAIQEANALAGADTITLPAGIYTLSLGANGEDAAEEGDLDVSSDITINGAGAATTVIQAGTTNLDGIDRVFEVLGGGGVLDVSDVTLRYGQEDDGAAIMSVGDLTIEDAILTENTGQKVGGAIFISGSGLNLTVRRVDFLLNAGDDGGAIGVKDATVLVEDSTFSGNTASRRGGGFHNDSGITTITGSTFTGNSANTEDGGGILNRGGSADLTVTNSTLSGNSAVRNGGGISIENTTTLLNVTVTANSASNAGGGIRVQSGTLNAKNTIVAGNTVGGNCSNAVFSQGYNLEDTDTCSFNQTGDQTNATALLGPLQDNGGPTETHALLTGSDAIDAGTNTGAPATDQRGVPRPIDGDGDATATVDVGAYEVALGTYLDQFNSVAYDGSDGTLDWTPNTWSEEQESTDPTSGRIQIATTAGYCASGGCLRLEGDSSTKDFAAVRRVDLTGATVATLTYDYRRENYYSCGTRVQASGDGGGSWDTLATYGTVSGDDPGVLNASHSLAPYIDGDPSDTQIRFLSYQWCDPGEYFHADDIQVATNGAPTPPAAIAPVAIWRRSGQNTPLYEQWDGSTFTGTQTSQAVGEWKVVQGAEAPSRDEAIVLGVDDGSGDVTGELWNGSTWSVLSINPLGNMSQTYWWGFDVAYEPVSGDAVVVSTDGGSLKSWVWNGATWSGPSTLTLPVAGTPRHLQLAAHPYEDEMVLIVSNSNSQDYAFVWDGASWGNSITLDGAGSGDRTDVYVAYEQQSGNALVVYGKGTDDVYYRRWTGSSWDVTESMLSGTGGGYARWTTLGADPGSNNIALGVLTNDSDVWLAVWNGSSWNDQATVTTSSTGTTEPAVAVAFEGTSGQALATYGESSNTPRYRTWTSGSGWDATEQSLPSIGGVPNSQMLYPEPGTDGIMLAVNDDSNHIHYLYWDGSSWGPDNELETNSGDNKNQPFLFLWPGTTGSPPANNAPTGISLVPSSVVENVVVGTVVGTLSSSDPDSGDSHTYALVA
ncbi:MAG: right-handed parallel beta-helix repeat-containing protein, partial [Acidimicrobiia bacterium]|nr:right-handed parallel beta-helix repeat-containing protein [Acidimicrobiia bacterium]